MQNPSRTCRRCAAPVPGRRNLCDACREHWGWCAGCQAVHPLSAFPAASPAAAARGSRHDPHCYASYRRVERRRRDSPPCRRCGGEREGHHRLCAACREHWGVCRDCGVQPRSAFAPAPPAAAARGAILAVRCRACTAAYHRTYHRESRAPLNPTARAATVAAIARASEGRLLTTEEEQVLGRLIRLRNDQAARNLMVERNDRMVWDVAFRYRGRGLEVDDLHGYGVLGLMRALEDWDERRGLKFSTYAYAWVRQAIQRATIDHGRLIRLPVHLTERVSKIAQATVTLTNELGRRPTDAEICAHTGIKPEHLATARIALVRSYPASLDASREASGDDDRALIEMVPDPTADDPLEQLEARAEASLAAEEVARFLAMLPPKLAMVLRLRYGLDDHGEARTLEQVGRLMGITRERVRQLEADALQHIRDTVTRRQLAPAAD